MLIHCKPMLLNYFWQPKISVLFLVLIHLAITGTSQSWTTELPTVGTFSSPRCTDLNEDGVMDLVFGAGREEFMACDSAVVALDGESGEILWKHSAADQIFGSANFLDINRDGISDIVIGGRSAELFAIDGKSGQTIWTFKEANNIKKPTDLGWFNFYNPQFIHDVDEDGLSDLIVANGGDVMVEPHDSNRPPGQLAVLSSANGEILARAFMPDAKETYMSIAVIPDSDPQVVFGTGGETVGGHLWIARLSSVLDGDLSQAVKLDRAPKKGYIGPPALVDISGDAYPDVIANSVDGRIMAFDGQKHTKIWEIEVPDTESYSSLCLGQFDADTITDFFVSFGRGVWPSLGWGIQKLVSGASGKVLLTDSLGFYQNTTAVAADLNADGRDEVIMSLNFHEVNEIFQKFFYTTIISLDFVTGAIGQIGEVYQGSNLSSTPWVGDLDQDGLLDIIYFNGTNLRHTYTFDGMQVHRLETEFKMPESLPWGAYQGTNLDALYRR